MDSYKDEKKEDMEDALFAVLLDELAEEEGAYLLEENARLLADEDCPLPEGYEERMEQFLRREVGKKKRKAGGHRMRFVAGWICTLLLLAGIGVVCSVDAVRSEAINFLMNLQGTYTDFRLENETASPVETPTTEVNSILASLWVPDGYYMQSINNGTLVYENNLGKNIFLMLSSEVSGFSLDEENAVYAEDIQVGPWSGRIALKDGFLSLVWHDTTRGIIFYLRANALDEETLLQIAESTVLQ